MTRTHRSAKSAGTSFERLIADTLAEHIDDRIDRRPRNGNKDRGDVGGVRLSPALQGGRIVIEAKCPSRKTADGQERPLQLGTWYGEADVERGNDDAVAGLVAFKRHGKSAGLDQWITCTVRDLVALITGERPE